MSFDIINWDYVVRSILLSFLDNFLIDYSSTGPTSASLRRRRRGWRGQFPFTITRVRDSASLLPHVTTGPALPSHVLRIDGHNHSTSSPRIAILPRPPPRGQHLALLQRDPWCSTTLQTTQIWPETAPENIHAALRANSSLTASTVNPQQQWTTAGSCCARSSDTHISLSFALHLQSELPRFEVGRKAS